MTGGKVQELVPCDCDRFAKMDAEYQVPTGPVYATEGIFSALPNFAVV